MRRQLMHRLKIFPFRPASSTLIRLYRRHLKTLFIIQATLNAVENKTQHWKDNGRAIAAFKRTCLIVILFSPK